MGMATKRAVGRHDDLAMRIVLGGKACWHGNTLIYLHALKVLGLDAKERICFPIARAICHCVPPVLLWCIPFYSEDTELHL